MGREPVVEFRSIAIRHADIAEDGADPRARIGEQACRGVTAVGDHRPVPLGDCNVGDQLGQFRLVVDHHHHLPVATRRRSGRAVGRPPSSRRAVTLIWIK